MNYTCELIEKKAQPSISIRTRTSVEDLPNLLGQAFERLYNYLMQAGKSATGAPYVAYFNMDMQDLDIEIGFPTAETLAGENDLQPGEIPAGKYASCIHTGPYNQIESAYNALMQWIAENNLVTSGVAYEIYLNDPDQTPPEELETQILFPLK